MTISTSLVFRATVDLVDSIETVVLIGRREALKTSSWPKQLGLDSGSFEAMVARCAPGDAGASTTTWIETVGGFGCLPKLVPVTMRPVGHGRSLHWRGEPSVERMR